MDFEKYTDRARGFVQSAQSLAQREGHQQFAPEHLLKVLLDDPEGLAAGLIDRSGGRSREALTAVEAALAKYLRVLSGSRDATAERSKQVAEIMRPLSPLVLTEQDARRIFVAGVMVEPGLVLLAGLVVVGLRRRGG